MLLGESSGRRSRADSFGSACSCQLCQSEVQHFGVVMFGDEDIGRLDVAMDDAFAVRSLQSIGDLIAEVDDVV